MSVEARWSVRTLTVPLKHLASILAYSGIHSICDNQILDSGVAGEQATCLGSVSLTSGLRDKRAQQWLPRLTEHSKVIIVSPPMADCLLRSPQKTTPPHSTPHALCSVNVLLSLPKRGLVPFPEPQLTLWLALTKRMWQKGTCGTSQASCEEAWHLHFLSFCQVMMSSILTD